MKRILGLDLGTNSIGWALVEIDHKAGVVRILGLGSRILPMDAGEIGDFESSGKIKSAAAARTEKRGPRRLNERFVLRRDRLHLVLNLLNSLPEHYKIEIDFQNIKGEKSGQFKLNKEPKLAYLDKQDGRKSQFLFMDTYKEMLEDIGDEKIKNEEGLRIPYDWTLYYLRQKALKSKISLEELAWVLLSYNQKRGYEKTEVEDKSTKENEIIEELDLKVKSVRRQIDKSGNRYFEVSLDGNDQLVYKEYADEQMTFKNDLKEIVKISKVDEQGNVDVKRTEFKVIDIYTLTIDDVNYEKEDGKHKYTLAYDNGWKEIKQPTKFTFRYKTALKKSFDYIVETQYDYEGNIKPVKGIDRKLREPDFSDNSNDWTLLKKKTEKEALVFNLENGFVNEETGEPKKYISTQIYDVLRTDAITGKRTKIIGGMFQVVDRDFYREELNQIITTQKEFHSEFNDDGVFEQCVKTLYPKNKIHQDSLLKNKNTIQHLLTEDILLYQRPLKSKKSEIANCKYEIKGWNDILDKKTGKPLEEVDIETGEVKIKSQPIYYKVVSASQPYFQEFRIWEKLHNLRLIQLEKEVDGKMKTNVDVSQEYFSDDTYSALFQLLNNRKTFKQKNLLDFFKSKFKEKKEISKNFVWNYPEDEELKGNETRVSFATRFIRCGFSNYAEFLTQEKEIELWHYLYSVSYKERVADENKSATSFFTRFLVGSNTSDEILEKIVADFANYPKFISRYCAYSEKALKKLLPFIRMGKDRFTGKFDILTYWSDLEKIDFKKKSIPELLSNSNLIGRELEDYKKSLYDAIWKYSINVRIERILDITSQIDFTAENVDFSSSLVGKSIDGELPFPKGLFNSFRECDSIDDFTSLNLTKASYLVYGRHSELAHAKYWISPEQVRDELHQELKQHSLNNPVAEKVLLEMMQVVADIWDYYGEGTEKFFTNIHLEVGRELKKSAKEKENITTNQKANKSQNNRLRQVLEEFLAQKPYNANSKNSDHFERLKIIEEGAEHNKNTNRDFFKNKSYNKKEIEDILKKPSISKTEFDKYKLWIEQGYRSPYSGQVIKLTDLFDGTKYNIDHVFPQASITNNSLSNKVVCEVALNQLKSDSTARAFIQSQKGQPYLDIPVCAEEEYIELVKSQFSGNKRHILLSNEIPSGFTSSQLNNSRHIARKAMELLSHIVREPGEVEFRSKNVLPVTGKVTSELKRAWKLDEVWRELVAPRYQRMNELTQSNLFGTWKKAKSGHEYFDCNLDKSLREKDESYDIKRIDHRHHALDALIVALCTEDHVNYINNINSNSKSDDYGKQKQIEKYRRTLKRKIKFSQKVDEKEDKNWYYMLPGEIRRLDASDSLASSVLKKSYFYKVFESSEINYKKMVITALQHTIVTFKQNLRVINKTVNRYNNTPDKNKFVVQKGTSDGNKVNWAIRRSLGKDTLYGKKFINGEEKVVIRKDLDTTFNRAKIQTITDTGIQKMLNNHLKQFDTVELPFLQAVKDLNSIVEKTEFDAIVANMENDFKHNDDFFEYLKFNKYAYDKVDYRKLNVFVEDVEAQNFRDEAQFGKITEHPEIAFSPQGIESMNKVDTLKGLNGGRKHAPIRKVRISRGFGNQRALSEDKESVKSKQFVVNDVGSNIYLGFYERSYLDLDGNNVRERKFNDIGLIDLIESLKHDTDNSFHPLPDKMYDKSQNRFDRIFTLSPLDLVYVPNDEEIENPSLVDVKYLSDEQKTRIYKYVDGGESLANFIPISVAKPLWRFHGKKNTEIFKELNETGKISIEASELIQNEFGLGSQQNKNQNMIDGKTQIKRFCWKIQNDKLGNITALIK
jgi:CRISPR-associated endonuclease Csn1